MTNDQYTPDQSFEARLSRGVAVTYSAFPEYLGTRPLTASERRERNRRMVADQTNVAAYQQDAAHDAWNIRTLNLDALLRAGRI